MENKFKVGDVVMVIKLDTDFEKESYQELGFLYSELLLQKGTVVEVQDKIYNIKFQYSSYNWYFAEFELMLYDASLDMKTLGVLYGRKDV